MKWHFILNPEEKYLEIKVSGDLEKEALNQAAKESLAVLIENKFKKCLFDYRDIMSIVGVMDMYERPQEVSKMGVTKEIKIGVLVKQEDYQTFRFVETVYRNNGFNYKLFVNREDAIEFLK